MHKNDYIPLPADPSLRLHVEQGDPKPGPPRRASGPTVLHTNDPRFNPPAPPPLKRAALLFFVFCLFWFALRLRTVKPPQSSPALETERYLSVHLIHNASCLTRD